MPNLGIIASSISGNLWAPANDFDSIAGTVTVSTPVSSISFTSIPSTYRHLQIRYIARNAAVTDSVRTQFNSDGGSNYAWHSLRGSGAAATATASASTTYMEMPFNSYSGTTANTFGVAVVDILDYKDTNKYTTLRTLGGADLNGSGYVFFNSGLWLNTAAVSTITIFPSTGNFEQYSSFALYGVK
jgi:hypothetical protein